jgi:hypothetical protein
MLGLGKRPQQDRHIFWETAHAADVRRSGREGAAAWSSRPARYTQTDWEARIERWAEARLSHRRLGHMTDEIDFDFRLVGVGWGEGRLVVGDSSVIVVASYLSDALGDLLRALRALTEGATDANATWEDEPGEVRWVFGRDGPSVRVQVLNVGVTRSRRWLDEQVPLVELIRAFAKGVRGVLSRHGVSGYEEEWARHAFPTDDLETLEDWLSQQDR